MGILSKRRTAFAKDLSELGESKSFELRLRVKDDTPIVAKYYHMNPMHQKEMDTQLTALLEAGIIEEAMSGEYCSPCFMIPKKDPTKFRLIIDYREINRKLVKDEFPIPDIQAIFDALGGAQYLSILDLMAGYYQLSIEEGSRKYTAFKTRDNIYAWKRLPFGISIGPAGFIRMMTRLLAGLVYKGVLFYFDDVIIYSTNISEHISGY